MQFSVLVDASHIFDGGAKILLYTLLSELDKLGINYIVLVDKRLRSIECGGKIIVTSSNPIFVALKLIYIKYNFKTKNHFSFNSRPPTIKVGNSIVYFHNLVFFEESKINLKKKLKDFIKKVYWRIFITNIDNLIFQTPYGYKLFKEYITVSKKTSISFIPFFNDIGLKINLNNLTSDSFKKYDFIYPSLPYPHKNHLILLKAWEVLFDRGKEYSLVLTLLDLKTDYCNEVFKRIKTLQEKGLKIITFEVLSWEETMIKIKQSKAMIFPSNLESLGLGLVEACMCDVPILMSNAECLSYVVEADYTFDLSNESDLLNKIEKIHNYPKSRKILIENKLDDLIELIIN
ncbi:glycosyltransferase, family [Pedobacter glucosidilyticus]|nr:glycosyltransferase [Pedobacter glucosidilyticus]KHJ39132.1 glycosyltransferase, family [Pedobacter glucosidilyticus]